MKKIILFLAITLFVLQGLSAKKIDLQRAVVLQCGDIKIEKVIPFRGDKVENFSLKMVSEKLSDNVSDNRFTFTLESGESPASAVGVEYFFDNWSEENYVLIPAASYNGNRFDVYPVSYPPMFYDKKYHRVDLPVTINDVPRLNIEKGKSKLEVETGACTTPAVAIFFPKQKRAVFYFTTQGTVFGNNGITVEESDDKKSAVVRFSAPETRETYYGGQMSARKPAAIDWKSGDSATLRIQRHEIECDNVNEMFAYYAKHRKDVTGINQYRNITPFSVASKMAVNIQDSLRWYNQDGWEYYKSGNGDSPFGHIQIGFCGEIVKEYPMLWSGRPLSIDRCAKTFDIIFGQMQGKSGLLYGMFRKGELKGDNFGDMDKNPDWVLMRKNCDALTYMVKNLMVMRKKGIYVNPLWIEGTRKLADAFVNMWNKYGQFGQYNNPKTGEIIVGGSTAGAYGPAGLALAYEYFGDNKYLDVAKASAEMYYKRDVQKGYTTGHAAEVLQSPDADSAYALLASFVTVAEVSGDNRFWDMAKDMANIFSSWTVSYDYKFPENSILDRAQCRSTGAVWASVQNKHAAPGICQYSGDALLKLYRKTGDEVYLNLIKDISHNLLEFMSTKTRPVGLDADGAICERVQMSDWEGGNVGYVGGYYNAWVEQAIMLTAMEIPGIYLQCDNGKLMVFDHVDAKILGKEDGKVILEISNTTLYDAEVSLLAEDSRAKNSSLGAIHYVNYPKIKVDSKKSVKIAVDSSGSVEKL